MTFWNGALPQVLCPLISMLVPKVGIWRLPLVRSLFSQLCWALSRYARCGAVLISEPNSLPLVISIIEEE